MAKIEAPNREYTGVSCGVAFVNGKGETTDKRKIEWFKERGYAVDGKTQEPVQEHREPPTPPNGTVSLAGFPAVTPTQGAPGFDLADHGAEVSEAEARLRGAEAREFEALQEAQVDAPRQPRQRTAADAKKAAQELADREAQKRDARADATQSASAAGPGPSASAPGPDADRDNRDDRSLDPSRPAPPPAPKRVTEKQAEKAENAAADEAARPHDARTLGTETGK